MPLDGTGGGDLKTAGDEAAPGFMRLTERNTHAPSGLTRFLVAHESCPKGLEILRDRSLVTVVCHGCESSFSYLTEVTASEPTEVERALEELAEGRRSTDAGESESAGEAPASDGRREAGPATAAPRLLAPPGPAPPGSAVTAPPANGSGPSHPRRLPPPGPHARRQRRRARAGSRRHQIAARAKTIVRAASRRRRPIAMAAMSLAGAYVVVALSAGGEEGASDTGSPLGSADLPLQAAPPGEAEDPIAGDARTLEPTHAGGPDAAPTSGANGAFELTLPSGWKAGSTDAGNDLYEAPSEAAQVLVRVEPAPKSGLARLADRGAAVLAMRLSPRAEVKRIPARAEGELLAVARSSGGEEVQTAYVTSANGLRYMVVSSHDDDASALDRLQAEAIVRSFEPSPDG